MTTERESQRDPPEDLPGEGLATDFHALFEASPVPLLVLAPPDFKIVAANEARLRATMTERRAILGRPLFEIFPDDPNDPQASGVRNLKASLERVLATRSADAMPEQRYPIRRPAAQGGGFEERWWAPVNAPVLGPDGQVQLIIHRVEDVTETVRLRAAHDQLLRDQEAANQRLRESDAVLRTSEQRQRFLLKLGDRLRAESNPEGVIAVASQALGEALKAWRIVYSEIDEEAGLARIRQGWAATGAEVRPAELRLGDFSGPLLDSLRAGKTVRYDDVGSAPYFRDDFAALAAIGIKAGVSVPLIVGGRLTVNLNVHQDRPRVWNDAEVELIEAVAERVWAAVERARVEARLSESEERYRSLFDQLVAGIAESDLAGRIITANDRYCEMLGYSREEILRLNMQDITHPDDLPGNLEQFRRCREEGMPFQIEKRYVRKDGSTVWVHNSVSLVRDANGEPKSMVAAVLDISERVHTERALTEANRAKDDFLAMLGHELRNPLSPIVTTLQLMKLRAPDTLAAERAIIEQQVHYISDMVDDLLDVARIARGKIELKTAPLAIAEIAGAAI
ncbi:MAG TPA: PAS domain S-box protein, partial [Rhodanobacteraceae bacterium]|nr:PAS domain S-box protein [Rhodanobacteraceae bacterium]